MESQTWMKQESSHHVVLVPVSTFPNTIHLIFQILHPYSNFSNQLELDITLQLHCSNYLELLELRNPQSHVIPKSVTHNNRGSGN